MISAKIWLSKESLEVYGTSKEPKSRPIAYNALIFFANR
jgi:hypothetical protein